MKVTPHDAPSPAAPSAVPHPRTGTAAAARLVSDEQIAALVSAAARLRRRQLDPPPGDVGAEQRRARLDWAVHAGRLALADRTRARAAHHTHAEAGR